MSEISTIDQLVTGAIVVSTVGAVVGGAVAWFRTISGLKSKVQALENSRVNYRPTGIYSWG